MFIYFKSRKLKKEKMEAKGTQLIPLYLPYDITQI